MKYNRVEVYADEYTVLFRSKRTNKIKTKSFSACQEWLCRRAPLCDETATIPQGTEEVYAADITEKWREELKKFYSSKCRKGVVVEDVQIKAEIIKNTPCADFSVDTCLKMMTPEQFSSEFGEILLDILSQMQYNKNKERGYKKEKTT